MRLIIVSDLIPCNLRAPNMPAVCIELLHHRDHTAVDDMRAANARFIDAIHVISRVVAPLRQGQGIGRQLLELVKPLRSVSNRNVEID
jgi:GNAT superfamily N-acetyltransferase